MRKRITIQGELLQKLFFKNIYPSQAVIHIRYTPTRTLDINLYELLNNCESEIDSKGNIQAVFLVGTIPEIRLRKTSWFRKLFGSSQIPFYPEDPLIPAGLLAIYKDSAKFKTEEATFSMTGCITPHMVKEKPFGPTLPCVGDSIVRNGVIIVQAVKLSDLDEDKLNTILRYDIPILGGIPALQPDREQCLCIEDDRYIVNPTVGQPIIWDNLLNNMSKKTSNVNHIEIFPK